MISWCVKAQQALRIGMLNVWRAGVAGGLGVRRSGTVTRQDRSQEDVEEDGLWTADGRPVLSVVAARWQAESSQRDDVPSEPRWSWCLLGSRLAQEVQVAYRAWHRSQSKTMSTRFICL